MRVLIIGYGNPLRGDDGFGYRTAESLRDRINDPDVEVLASQQLLPEHMERIAAAERVLLIDAGAGSIPGEVRERRIEAPAGGTRFTHELTVEGAVAGARLLYGWGGEATLITVAGENFDAGFGLSRVLELRLKDITGKVLNWIARGCKIPFKHGEL